MFLFTISPPHRGKIRNYILWALLSLTIQAGCSNWTQGQATPRLRHLNSEALKQIKIADPANFSFVMLGDNKGNGPLFAKLLQQVGKESRTSFVFDDGDLVPRGKEKDFKIFLDLLRANLRLPLLTAIGNHDTLSGGTALYRSIFGPTYYSFRFGKTAFFVVDDATPEAVNETQLQWLAGELRGGAGCEQRFVILHVPLYDPRGGKNNHCLPRETAAKLLEIFKTGKVSRVFAGHIHEYATGDWDGIPFVISGGAGAELAGNDPAHDFHHYLVVEVAGPKVAIQVRKVASSKIR